MKHFKAFPNTCKKILMCCLLIYGIFSFIVSAIGIILFYDFNDQLQNVMLTLQSSPIQEILLQPIQGYCPIQYREVKLFEFPGTQRGCYCNGGVIRKGSCLLGGRAGRLSCEGSIIQPTHPYYFYSYQMEENFEFKVCVKPYRQFDLSAFYPDLYSGLCTQEGYLKPCYSSNGKLLYCVGYEQKCPINDIKIQMINPNINQYRNWTKISHNLYLFESRNKDKSAIFNLQMEYSGGVCRDTKYREQPIESDQLERYPLLKRGKTKQCKLDTRFEEIANSTQSEFNFFKSNKFLFINESLPVYRIQQANYTFSLYAQRVSFIDNRCRPIAFPRLMDSYFDLKYLERLNLAYFIFSIYLVIVGLISTRYIYFLQHLAQTLTSGISGRESFERKTPFFVNFFSPNLANLYFQYFFSFLSLFLTMSIILFTQQIQSNFDLFFQNDCSDDLTLTDTLRDYSQMCLTKILKANLVQIIFSPFIFLLPLYVSCFRYFQRECRCRCSRYAIEVCCNYYSNDQRVYEFVDNNNVIDQVIEEDLDFITIAQDQSCCDNRCCDSCFHVDCNCSCLCDFDCDCDMDCFCNIIGKLIPCICEFLFSFCK